GESREQREHCEQQRRAEREFQRAGLYPVEEKSAQALPVHPEAGVEPEGARERERKIEKARERREGQNDRDAPPKAGRRRRRDRPVERREPEEQPSERDKCAV